MLVMLAPAAALAVGLYAVDLPLYAEGPGPARDVVPRIDLDGIRTYEPDGRFLLTTVSVEPLSVVGMVGAWLDPDRDVIPERQVIPPGETEREYERQTRSDMDESKLAAAVYALERLTDYPKEHGRGVLVQDVFAGTPADGRLYPGDLILEAGGRKVEALDDVGAAIDRAGTERAVTLLVEAGGERETVRLRPARLAGHQAPIIGVVLIASFPVEVRIESGDVGGPSAGMMWALGLLDLLAPGDLTGGRTVAGTGTIDLEGNVGPIGGVRHKVLAAERAGADLFLVPAENLAEARGAGADVRLVPVRSVEDAVRYLEGGS